MSTRKMDLRPIAVRDHVRESTERSFVSRAAVVSGCLLVAAWTVGAVRLGTARSTHAEVVDRAEETMAIERDLASTMGDLDELGEDLSAWRRVTIPFETGPLVAAIVVDLPESATLERLELDASSLVATPLRTGRRDAGGTRRIDGELEGFAASDDAVAEFVEALGSRPFFRRVRVESTRHLDLDGDPARAFRIAFDIDLEAASPAPTTSPDQGGGS